MRIGTDCTYFSKRLFQPGRVERQFKSKLSFRLAYRHILNINKLT